MPELWFVVDAKLCVSLLVNVPATERLMWYASGLPAVCIHVHPVFLIQTTALGHMLSLKHVLVKASLAGVRVNSLLAPVLHGANAGALSACPTCVL